MDFYLNDENVINRLTEEWSKYGKLIIAYDYDNTVHDYHKLGYVFENVISLLKRTKLIGANFIVFTCCNENKYDDIKKYLSINNIPFDKINENIDDIDFGGRKVYYNILLDDRAGLSSAYNCLLKVVEMIENKNNI